MIGMSGAGIPDVIRRADAFLTRLREYKECFALKGVASKLADEAEVVIRDLKQHAKDEYIRGYGNGKKRIINNICEKLDPPTQDYLKSYHKEPEL